MANNYVQFSFRIILDNQQEAEWFGKQLEDVPVNNAGAQVDWEANDCSGELPLFLAGSEHYDADSYAGLGASWHFEPLNDEPGSLKSRITATCYSEESGDPGLVAVFLQKYLREFHPDGSLGLEYACTCSKPRAGEFGGGAYFVTADEIREQSSMDWLMEQERQCTTSGCNPR